MLAKYIYKNMPSKPADFDVPDSIIELRIDSLALNKFHKAMLATPNTPIEYQKSEIFDISNSPMEFSPFHHTQNQSFGKNAGRLYRANHI